MTDEKVAINYGKQLNDRHINHGQVIINHQFGIKGWQLTLYQHTRKPVENELQIIHSRNNHWITASTVLSIPDVYYSLFDNVDADTTMNCLASHISNFRKCQSNRAVMTVACLQ